jgi:hypothetical protein
VTGKPGLFETDWRGTVLFAAPFRFAVMKRREAPGVILVRSQALIAYRPMVA